MGARFRQQTASGIPDPGVTPPLIPARTAARDPVRMRCRQNNTRAKTLRANMTDAEHHLWRALRRRGVAGMRFRRQCPIGPFVVDFACLEKRLVIEVDGGQHCDSTADRRRDAFLKASGFQVMRFWNHDVLANLEAVVQVLAMTAAPSPTLPRKRGRE